MNVPTESTAPSDAASTFDEGGHLLGRPGGVSCPACGSGLEIGEIAECQFAGCPNCRGMLFQQEVFGGLLRHLRRVTQVSPLPCEPLHANELKVKRVCPGCGNCFETHAYGGPGNAVIDSCFPCQLIWLDHGEFTKLVHAPGQR